MNTDVDRVVAQLVPDPGPGMSEGAHELMHEIMTADPAPVREPLQLRRRLPLRVALPGVALVTAAVLALTWLLPSGPGFGPDPVAALDIRQEGGYYVVEIKDLYADPDRYQAQLRAAGLDVTLRVRPSTPAFVGQIFPTSRIDMRYLDEIKMIERPGTCENWSGCPLGMKIPVGFKGPAYITIGREARPGERFENRTSFDARGEPMHCVDYLNKPLAQVRGMLRERGVAIEDFMVTDPDGDGYEVSDSVPDSWLVHGGFMNEPGKATVAVHENPLSEERLANLRKQCQES